MSIRERTEAAAHNCRLYAAELLIRRGRRLDVVTVDPSDTVIVPGCQCAACQAPETPSEFR